MNASQLLGEWLAWIVPATIQLSLLVALVTPLAYAMRAFPAQFRHALWLLVFAKAFIMPELSAPWAIGTWGIPAALDGKLAVLRLFANPVMGAHGALLSADDVGIRATLLPFHTIPLAQGTPYVLALALFAVWLIGVSTMVLLIAHNQWELQRELGRARRVTDGPLLLVLKQIAHEYGIVGLPRLLLSADATTPFICGVWRQTIVLPATLPGALTPVELRAVLAHELVHARRRDPIACWGQMIALSIFWFNPLLWFAHRMMNGERELAVDETVLRRGLSQPIAYARAILRVMEESSGRCGILATGFLGGVLRAPDLETRIARLFAIPRVRRSGSLGAWLGVFLFAAVMLPMGRPGEQFARENSAQIAAPLRQ